MRFTVKRNIVEKRLKGSRTVVRVPYFLERKNAPFPDACGKMVLNQIGQTDTMAPNGIQCPAISAGRNLPQTISFCRGLTSFANFRFFSACFCFRNMKGVQERTLFKNRIGQADTFCLRGAGQRVRQDADRQGGERKWQSEQHRAARSLWHG